MTAQMAIAFQTLDGLGRAGEGRLMLYFINVVNPPYKKTLGMDTFYAIAMINEVLLK